MNIAYEWYMNHGKKLHDSRTTTNVLSESFINHAKSCATEEEQRYIDECVTFQASPRDGSNREVTQQHPYIERAI